MKEFFIDNVRNSPYITNILNKREVLKWMTQKNSFFQKLLMPLLSAFQQSSAWFLAVVFKVSLDISLKKSSKNKKIKKIIGEIENGKNESLES